MKAALLEIKFYRFLSRACLSAVGRAEDRAIEKAKKMHGRDGNPPGMSCGCGDCWRYWVQSRA